MTFEILAWDMHKNCLKPFGGLKFILCELSCGTSVQNI